MIAKFRAKNLFINENQIAYIQYYTKIPYYTMDDKTPADSVIVFSGGVELMVETASLPTDIQRLLKGE